jgi:hypothetical protein
MLSGKGVSLSLRGQGDFDPGTLAQLVGSARGDEIAVL